MDISRSNNSGQPLLRDEADDETILDEETGVILNGGNHIYSNGINGHKKGLNGLNGFHKNIHIHMNGKVSEGLEDHDHHHREISESEAVGKRFPKEKKKTLIAFLLLYTGFVFNAISIVLTHERVPDRNVYPPLPDVFLDNLDAHKWANNYADLLVIVLGASAISLIAFHKHRWIIFRRLFLILSCLYIMRSITMYVTNLPLSNNIVVCAPKQNTTSVGTTLKRAFQLLGGMGLPILGQKKVCGDYIYSGHTLILYISYMIIQEYSPKKMVTFHWASWLLAISGMVALIYSRGHYTVDVIIAYYVTTRIFWMYHTMANNNQLKISGANNFLSKVWWYPIFFYFEKNVRGNLPNQYSAPWAKSSSSSLSSSSKCDY